MSSLDRTQALLLRKTNYSDTSLVTAFYTENYGKIHFMVKGARRIKNSFVGSFEHFSCYEILFLHRPGKHGLTTLREAHLVEGFSEVREDLQSFYHACYIVELLDGMTEMEDSDPVLFEITYDALDLMKSAENLDLKTLSYETRLLSHLGFLGDTTLCSSCQELLKGKVCLDPKSTRLFCSKCFSHEDWLFKWDEIRWLPMLKAGQIPDLSVKSREALRKLIWFCIDFHLKKPLKSRKFLLDSHRKI